MAVLFPWHQRLLFGQHSQIYGLPPSPAAAQAPSFGSSSIRRLPPRSTTEAMNLTMTSLPVPSLSRNPLHADVYNPTQNGQQGPTSPDSQQGAINLVGLAGVHQPLINNNNIYAQPMPSNDARSHSTSSTGSGSGGISTPTQQQNGVGVGSSVQQQGPLQTLQQQLPLPSTANHQIHQNGLDTMSPSVHSSFSFPSHPGSHSAAAGFHSSGANPQLLHYSVRPDLINMSLPGSFGRSPAGPQIGAFAGGGRKYSCKACTVAFDSKAELHVHTQMHMREAKPYKCTHCVKSFANSSYLSQHMRIHLGIKPFGPCQYCGKKFTQLSHLQQHIRTHTGEKPYKCKYPGCEKAFSQLSNLQSHSRCHQSDKPYKCNSCYKCFTDEQALLDHIPKHKESKHLKVHICPYCGKSYTQATYLAKHMTKHADRRDRDTRLRNELGDGALDPLGGGWAGRDPTTGLCNLHGIPDTCAETGAAGHLAFNSFANANHLMQQQSGACPYPGAVAVSVANPMSHMVNDPSAFTRLAGLAAGFQRSLSGPAVGARGHPYFTYDNSLKTDGSRGHHGFNMMTPLESIQQYSARAAGAAASSPQQFSNSMLSVGGIKRDMSY